MEFVNVGRTFQMLIKSGKDLEDVLRLDEALWAATSAPVSAFHLDEVMAKGLDPQGTGRITSNNLKAAIRWMLEQLPDHEAIREDFDGMLQLSALSESSSDGKALLSSCRYILNELEAPSRTAISCDQIRAFLETVAKRPLNGDGILSLAAAGNDDAFRSFLADVVKATGGAKDFDGTQGASEKNIVDFLAAAGDYLAWLKGGKIPAGEERTEIMSFGAETASLAALLHQHEGKVNEFFKLSAMMAFDSRLAAQALGPVGKAAAFDPANQSEVDAYLAGLPLAEPTGSEMLTLDASQVSPLYRGWWKQVCEKIIRVVLPEANGLNAAEWSKICGMFAAYDAYLAGKKGALVEAIPPESLEKYVADAELLPKSKVLQVADKSVADIVAGAKKVDLLLKLRTNMLRIVNNFVSFPDLYAPEKHAIFECGSMVIDGRWFHLALESGNVGAHSGVAKNSMMCLMYVEVKTDKGPVNYVLPVTYGSKGNLSVGKRGVFFAHDGREYDAVVVQLIDNPVCVREALLAPFGRLWRIVESKIEGWAGTADKKLQENFAAAITPGSAPAPAPVAKKEKAGDKSGMFLGASVAVAALGSAFAFISKTLSGMSGTSIILTVVCALLVLLLPVTILTMLKLNKQDLSSILEGCGWAINLRMRLTSQLRGQFTNFGKYPKDAGGTPKKLGYKILVVFLLLAIIAGCMTYACNCACCNSPCSVPVQTESCEAK